MGGPKGGLPETYDKFFTFDRYYNLRWDLTRSFNIDFTAVNKSWIDEDSGRLDDGEKKRMWHNFWKGGRTISYNQHAEFSYNVPMSKIPALNWTTLRASYAADFDWIGASLIARELGNTLSNQQRKTLTFEMDFTQLYAKSRFLRAIEEEGPAAPKPPRDPKDTTSKKKRDRNEPLVLSPGAKFAGRFLTMVKRAKLEYSEVAGATIYGYTDSTRALGMNFRSGAPGLPFIFGKQPDTSFISTMAQKGWLSADSNFNFQNRQDYTQRFNITAQLQPIRDLMIDITIDKQFGKNYSELYKDTTGTGLHFARLNPYSAGSFRVTYISFQTLFQKVEANEVSQIFQRFQDYRLILSRRLAESNPYWQSLPETEKFLSDGYYRGYSRYAQDVLIPAFIAAYTGKDPKSVPLLKQNNPNIRSNPFSGILPRPNWRITLYWSYPH